jgi:hypothetical protein
MFHLYFNGAVPPVVKSLNCTITGAEVPDSGLALKSTTIGDGAAMFGKAASNVARLVSFAPFAESLTPEVANAAISSSVIWYVTVPPTEVVPLAVIVVTNEGMNVASWSS